METKTTHNQHTRTQFQTTPSVMRTQTAKHNHSHYTNIIRAKPRWPQHVSAATGPRSRCVKEPHKCVSIRKRPHTSLCRHHLARVALPRTPHFSKWLSWLLADGGCRVVEMCGGEQCDRMSIETKRKNCVITWAIQPSQAKRNCEISKHLPRKHGSNL